MRSCPLCGCDTRVYDSRFDEDRNVIQRRRECLRCGERVVTEELYVHRVKGTAPPARRKLQKGNQRE